VNKVNNQASSMSDQQQISPASTQAEKQQFNPASTAALDPETQTHDMDDEQKHLATAQANRFEITQQFTKELNDIQTKCVQEFPRFKGKNKLRKQLVKTIFRVAMTTYATEDDEYAAIGKFLRGIFRHASSDKIFDKTEQEILTNIARVYGAFDY